MTLCHVGIKLPILMSATGMKEEAVDLCQPSQNVKDCSRPSTDSCGGGEGWNVLTTHMYFKGGHGGVYGNGEVPARR